MKPTRNRSGKTLLFVVVLLALAAGGAALWWYFTTEQNPAPIQPGPPPPLTEVSGRGHIEPEGGVLSLGIPGPDRIAEVHVHEGDTVRAGQVLVVFESHRDRRLEKELADAKVAAARAQLKALTASGEAQVELENLARQQVAEVEPLEIETQKRKIKVLGEQLANARANWERVRSAGSDIISKQEREQQELLVRQSETELAAANYLYEKLTRGHDLNLRQAEARVRAARANLDRLRSEISLPTLQKQQALAALRLEESQLRAPVAGRVLHVLLHQGELVGSQAILQMANTEHMIVVAEIYETDILRVKEGQRVTVESKVVPPPALTGTVIAKGGSIARGREYALDPRAAVDTRVVEVKVRLDQGERVADLIGLQVTVRIDTAGGQ